MPTTDPSIPPERDAPEPRAIRTPRRGRVRAFAAILALLALALTGAYALLAGQTGVDLVAHELVLRSGGKLAIDDATGSLLDTVRIRRVSWRGPEATMVAQDVALTWSPWALLSRGFVVRGLGARTLALDFKPSTTDVPLPASLALPFDVTIDHLGVGRLDWRVGANGGTIRGLAFGYEGGASRHRLTALELIAEAGTLTGQATLGAAPPFAIDGQIALAGDGTLAGASAQGDLGGTLERTTLVARGAARGASFSVRAAIAPLAVLPLKEIAVDASDVDLAAIDPSLPATRLAGALRAAPSAAAITGTIEATNALPGGLEQDRLPLAVLATRFTWREDTLALDDLTATLPGGGSARGEASMRLAGPDTEGRVSLAIRDANLRGLHGSLIATRLGGRIVVDVHGLRRRIDAELADPTLVGGLALDGTAQVDGTTVVVERFRARAAGGELAGRGRVGIADQRAFEVEAKATRFDPSRFGDLPAGTLDGRIAANGVLAPTWRVRADATVQRGSRLGGVALSGSARGTIAQDGVRDAAVDLAVGSSGRLAIDGTLATDTDRLTVTLDAPEIAELAPLLPTTVPRPLAGALHLRAQMHGAGLRAAFDIAASGRDLRVGDELALGRLDIGVSVAAGSGPDVGAGLAARAIRVKLSAANVATPPGRFSAVRANATGTLGQHRIDAALASEDVDTDATVHGGLIVPSGARDFAELSWSGALDTLENKGRWAFRLVAPASLDLARARVRLGEARLAVAEGNVRLAELEWNDGRIRTQGSFAAVPLATAARIAGITLPFASTLTLGGEWSLAAAPRLNGTATVRRESGDVWLVRGSASDPGLAAGLSRLEATARIADDAIDAVATLRSARAGTADATFAIGAVPGAAPGRLSPDAPLTLTMRGNVPTLRLLQPWIGTAFAVDGRARFELQANGTLRNAPLSGSLVGEGLRVDAPQYGLHFTDGRLAGHASGGRIVVDELTLRAGAGTFHATGEITELAPGGARPTAQLAWKAEHFRVFNRPDLRLVVGGEGNVTTRGGKLSLTGKLRADEGAIVYLATPDTRLGDDVVVKGWPRQSADARREGDVALEVDLALDLGDNLRFSGEGLETGLEGEVRVTNGQGGLLGKGSIRAVNGTYFAFGQKLTIDRGRLIFDGRLDNPGLDIVALRKGPAVEAGVAITGTVKVPVITLTSNPPVPDSEKLSWLVLGQGLERSGGADYAALQAASAALLGQRGRPVTATIAQSLGVDDISVKSASGTSRAAPGTPDATGQVVAVGKRLSDRITLVYEQGLTVATNALRIEYALTRSLTLRAEAGTISGVGVYYRRSFD